MKKLMLGIATAGVLLTAAAPAMAQVGFYAGPGGVDVQFGAPGYYDYYGGPYYDYYGPNVVVRGPGWHHHHYDHHWRY